MCAFHFFVLISCIYFVPQYLLLLLIQLYLLQIFHMFCLFLLPALAQSPPHLSLLTYLLCLTLCLSLLFSSPPTPNRCYLTVTSALVVPGHVIIDPFSGSGAILKVGTLFGSAAFSSDLDPVCCADSDNHPV
jgi:hypothetical protein